MARAAPLAVSRSPRLLPFGDVLRSAMVAGLMLSCSIPKVELGDCEATCKKGKCPGGLVCQSGYCVHEDSSASCGDAGRNAGGEAAGSVDLDGTAGGESAGGESAGGESAGGESAGGESAGGESAGGESNGGSRTASSGGAKGSGGGSAGVGGLDGVVATCGDTESCESTPGGCPERRANSEAVVTELTAGCLGEEYETALTESEGGDYVWSAELPAELGLALSPDGVLSGVLKTEGEFSFDVTLRDALTDCDLMTRPFALRVMGSTFGVCPSIVILERGPSSPAPAACRAWPYFTELVVSGGEEPYTWKALETPPGLAFDPQSHSMAGTATGDGTLTVRVRDGSGRAVRRSFWVPLREKCWFGYLSSAVGASRLNLFDPLLGARLQRPVSDSTGLSVEDFQFSPDGRFVAYRVRDTTGETRLWLWHGPEWDQEQELDLGGSVTHYAWSKNGLVLAAAITTADDTWLGGVDVSAVEDGARGAGIDGLRTLVPVSAPVDSDITWYGEDAYVSFDSRWAPELDYRVVNQASFGTLGFTDVVARNGASYEAPLFFQATDHGFFVFSPQMPRLDHVAVGQGEVTTHGNVAVDPAGEYVAAAADNQLSIYRATDTSGTLEPSVWSVAEGCTQLLAWASVPERLACVDSVAGIVALHSIDQATRSIATVPLLNSESYVESSWGGFPRLFSPNGNYIALATGNQLHLGVLDREVPEILWTASLGGGSSFVEMSFSPNEQFIMLHREASLLLFRTVDRDSWVNVANIGRVAAACEDDQLAHPSWCGRRSELSQPVWSADSQLLGVVDADASLVVIDLRPVPALAILDLVEVAPNCRAGCVGTGRFQP